jgi:hypothetical protein
MTIVNPFHEAPETCPKCLDQIIKIRQGKLKGVVLSCHPLDQISDENLAKYIQSKKVPD